MKKFSVTESNQKKYYNRIANEYDKHYAKEEALHYRYSIYDSLLNEFNFKDKLVLDAMCGGGQNTSFFLSKGATVAGIDISDNQCAFYKKRFPENLIFCQSILGNELAENFYDVIITDSLHHTHPNVKNCINEFNRLLKPGGLLILWEPSAKSIFDVLRNIWYKMDKKYFENNEKAIDLKRLTLDYNNKFELLSKKYGGNLAYLFVNLTMGLRIPTRVVKYYSKPLFYIDKFVSNFQTRHTALWFLVVYRKMM